MTAREIAELLDKEATLQVEALSVPVCILDAREVFGRMDVLVSPVGGSGEQWVSSERVKVTGG